jgi:hypothetical protein
MAEVQGRLFLMTKRRDYWIRAAVASDYPPYHDTSTCEMNVREWDKRKGQYYTCPCPHRGTWVIGWKTPTANGLVPRGKLVCDDHARSFVKRAKLSKPKELEEIND